MLLKSRFDNNLTSIRVILPCLCPRCHEQWHTLSVQTETCSPLVAQDVSLLGECATTSPTYGAVTTVIVHEPVCRTVQPVSFVTLPSRVGRGDALRRRWFCTTTTCGTSCLDLGTFRVQNEQRSASDQDWQADKIEQWDE